MSFEFCFIKSIFVVREHFTTFGVAFGISGASITYIYSLQILLWQANLFSATRLQKSQKYLVYIIRSKLHLIFWKHLSLFTTLYPIMYIAQKVGYSSNGSCLKLVIVRTMKASSSISFLIITRNLLACHAVMKDEFLLVKI